MCLGHYLVRPFINRKQIAGLGYCKEKGLEQLWPINVRFWIVDTNTENLHCWQFEKANLSVLGGRNFQYIPPLVSVILHSHHRNRQSTQSAFSMGEPCH